MQQLEPRVNAQHSSWLNLAGSTATTKRSPAMALLTRLSNGRHPADSRDGDHAQAFVVLPSHKSPRLLLPLGDREVALEGLEIYTPYARTARLAKKLLTGFVKHGWQGWGRHRVFIPSEELLPLKDLVREVTGEARPSFSISVGCPGSDQKLTVQAMKPRGGILGYLKLPLTAYAAQLVQHEAETLKRLAYFPALRPHIPVVLFSGEWAGGYILFQTAGPSCPGPVKFGALHERTLQILSNVQPSVRSGSALADEIARRWQLERPSMDAELYELGETALETAREGLPGERVNCGLSHGDFAPWNTRLGEGRLFLLDWESASWDAPNLWDAFHFHVQVARLLKRHNGRRWRILQDRAARASFFLYLLDSLCRSFSKAETPQHPRVQFRKRLLAGLLSQTA